MSQKVKCPYCDFRNTKPKVVNHIEKNHKQEKELLDIIIFSIQSIP